MTSLHGIQKVTTCHGHEYCVFVATEDGHVWRKQPTTAEWNAPTYFMRIVDIIRMITGEREPGCGTFEMDQSKFDIYIYQRDCFQRVNVAHEPVNRLFIRHDQLFQFMHVWLHSLLLWREKLKLPTPNSVLRLGDMMDLTDETQLFPYIITLECASYDTNNSTAEPYQQPFDYVMTATEIGHFQNSMQMALSSIFMSDYTRQPSIRFANLVFEGFLASKVHQQSTVKIVEFNRYLAHYRQQCGDVVTELKTIASNDHDKMAQALIAEEEAERDAALKKAAKKRAKRQRKKQKPVAPPLSKLNPEATPFVPNF